MQWVDGNRLWFAAAGAAGYQPGLRVAHGAGATLTKVTLATKTASTDYTVAPATGTITEVTEFGAGAAVLASYTTDFVMPAVYGPPLNDSPDLGPESGKWKGLPLVAGTYTVGVWGSRTLTLAQNGESQQLIAARRCRPTSTSWSARRRRWRRSRSSRRAPPARSATPTCSRTAAAGAVSTPACSATAAPGPKTGRGTWRASAPATPGAIVEFRSMLHKIHRGANPDLTNVAVPFSVVGFGAAAYPNNFSVLTFDEDEFPAMPERRQGLQRLPRRQHRLAEPGRSQPPDGAASRPRNRGAWPAAAATTPAPRSLTSTS